MKQIVPGRTGLWTAGFALCGIAGAHWLAYQLVSPGPGGARTLMESTGHGYWPVFVIAALVALAVGMFAYARHRLTDPAVQHGHRRLVSFAALLCLAQVPGFLILEAAERLAYGVTLDGFFLEPAIIVGLLLQPVFALAGAALSVLFGASIDCIARRLRRHHPRTRTRPRGVALSASFSHLDLQGSITLRGPPAPIS